MLKRTSKTEVRRLLRSIETVLMRQDYGSQALWNILTALRGPDTEARGKGNTIAVRRAAFPRLASEDSGYANGAAFSFLGWPEPLATIDLLTIPHFGDHTYSAASALRILATKGRWA